MPHFSPRFRPPPTPPTPLEPPLVVPSLEEEVEAAKLLEKDAGFDEELVVGRVEPKPRMRMLAAGSGPAGFGQAAPTPVSGSSVRNPFMDKVSITKSDVNPYRIFRMLGLR